MNTKNLKTIALAAVAGLALCANAARADEVQELFNKIYPVGSIYISVGDTLPTSFTSGGMTWVKLTDGQFLMSANGTTTAGTTGGTNSMTLKTENMPSHSHGGNTLTPSVAKFSGIKCNTYANNIFSYGHWWYATTQSSEGVSYGEYTMNTSGKWTGATTSVGSGKAFDNRPAYLAVSMWKRTN